MDKIYQNLNSIPLYHLPHVLLRIFKFLNLKNNRRTLKDIRDISTLSKESQSLHVSSHFLNRIVKLLVGVLILSGGVQVYKKESIRQLARKFQSWIHEKGAIQTIYNFFSKTFPQYIQSLLSAVQPPERKSASGEPTKLYAVQPPEHESVSDDEPTNSSAVQFPEERKNASDESAYLFAVQLLEEHKSAGGESTSPSTTSLLEHESAGDESDIASSLSYIEEYLDNLSIISEIFQNTKKEITKILRQDNKYIDKDLHKIIEDQLKSLHDIRISRDITTLTNIFKTIISNIHDYINKDNKIQFPLYLTSKNADLTPIIDSYKALSEKYKKIRVLKNIADVIFESEQQIIEALRDSNTTIYKFFIEFQKQMISYKQDIQSYYNALQHIIDRRNKIQNVQILRRMVRSKKNVWKSHISNIFNTNNSIIGIILEANKHIIMPLYSIISINLKANKHRIMPLYSILKPFITFNIALRILYYMLEIVEKHMNSFDACKLLYHLKGMVIIFNRINGLKPEELKGLNERFNPHNSREIRKYQNILNQHLINLNSRWNEFKDEMNELSKKIQKLDICPYTISHAYVIILQRTDEFLSRLIQKKNTWKPNMTEEMKSYQRKYIKHKLEILKERLDKNPLNIPVTAVHVFKNILTEITEADLSNVKSK